MFNSSIIQESIGSCFLYLFGKVFTFPIILAFVFPKLEFVLIFCFPFLRNLFPFSYEEVKEYIIAGLSTGLKVNEVDLVDYYLVKLFCYKLESKCLY